MVGITHQHLFRRFALFIHGIIGDTESLVNNIKQSVLQADGQKCSISELYDVVLTFDYENLNTSIEHSAQYLKRRLAEVGLGANHGKELHIYAYKCTVESEEGVRERI